MKEKLLKIYRNLNLHPVKLMLLLLLYDLIMCLIVAYCFTLFDDLHAITWGLLAIVVVINLGVFSLVNHQRN